MSNTNDDAHEVERLRRDIAKTRADIADTVGEIEQRLSPGNIRARLKTRAAEAMRSAKERSAAVTTQLSRRAEDVPTETVAGAGAGLATFATLVTFISRRQRAQRLQRVQVRAQRQRTAAASGLAVVVILAGMMRARRRDRVPTVRQVMTPAVATVVTTDPLTSAAARMADLDVGSLPVLDASGKLAGMLTDRDIVVKAVARGQDPRVVTAAQVAEAPVVTVGAEESVARALQLMSRHAVRRLPVVDGDSLVGFVAQADLAMHVDDSEVGVAVEDVSAAPGDHVPTSRTPAR